MAADAVISAVLEKLTSIALDEIDKEVRRVINVRGEVNKLSSNFQAIKAVLEDAERQQLEKGKASVRDWLDKLKDVSYDIDNALDEWSTAIHKSELEPQPKVCSFVPSPSYCFNRGKLLLKTTHKIQALNERLDVIANERERYGFKVLNSEKPKRDETTSFINVAEVMGRVEDKERIVNMLLNEGRAEEIGSEIQMISMVGIGGIGKTTLAKLAFNNEQVESHFEVKIWVCVSDTFDEMRIAKDILKSLIGNANKDVIEKLYKLNHATEKKDKLMDVAEKMDKLMDAIEKMDKLKDAIDKLDKLEDILHNLKTSIEGKKFLLVLDDVWTEEYGKWEQLKTLLLNNGSQGSKILVTTRKEKVAISMGCGLFKVGQLSGEEGWSLFSQIAFFGRSNDDCRSLEEIAREIAKKCKGLPLALKALGGLLRWKKSITEWQSVLESGVWELEEVEEGLFHPLMFSYFDLPSHLRQCFSYCAIFPKDYVIEKKKLIELWMAQGFLKGTQDMEMVGENNFNDLSMRFLFQDFEMDENGGIIKCKMHDMVHDFAIFLTRGACLTMESSSSIQAFNVRPHHLLLMMHNEDGTPIPTCIYNAESLRTLLIESNERNLISHMELLKLFDKLKCLRILKYSNCGIKKCPKQIGKLIHLRHLDLSGNRKLKKLPEIVCDLCNLLVLDITRCDKLKRLPCRMGNLVNLLHLRNENTYKLNFMPKGMEKLTSLRTLNKFAVTCKGAALSDLGNLNHLCGTLEITGLGIVRDVKEAEKVQLQSRKRLTSLSLQFDANGLRMSQSNESASLVLEALKPPLDLETLDLNGNGSPLACIWPSWAMSLTKLKELVIGGFENVEQLPPLGKWPSLKSLRVGSMSKVKKVGVEFLGIEMSLSPSSSSVVAFPNLKTLEFRWMPEWEEWEEWDFGSGEEIMPCLSSLTILVCPKLKKLPNYILRNTTLLELIIFWSSDALISNLFKEDCRPHISCISNMDVEGEKEIVSHTNPIVWAGPSWTPPLANLKNIEILDCSIEHLPPLGKLPSLESLKVNFNYRVKKVGVEFLGIETSLPPSSSSVFAFSNLKSLTFESMLAWEEWDYESKGEEDITIMPRLSSLTILDCKKLKRLPDYILQSTTLQELTIINCSCISKRCKEDYQPFINRIPHSRVSS
ncbi:hypothetical protein SLA2020_033500 [Shorea laevis]